VPSHGKVCVKEKSHRDVVRLKYLTKQIFAGYILLENFISVSNMQIADARNEGNAVAGAANEP